MGDDQFRNRWKTAGLEYLRLLIAKCNPRKTKLCGIVNHYIRFNPRLLQSYIAPYALTQTSDTTVVVLKRQISTLVEAHIVKMGDNQKLTS